MTNEIEKRNEAFLIYQDENGVARVNVRFEGEDVWLNVEQMMELFDASQQDISYHIKQIYTEGEQVPERTHKKFLLVRQEGNRSVKRQMSHYNLDKIIAVGYTLKTMAAGLWAYWNAKTFEDGLLSVVRAGGDADTNAAVACAILGAKFGFNSIPKEYVDGLIYKEQLDVVVKGICDIAKV